MIEINEKTIYQQWHLLSLAQRKELLNLSIKQKNYALLDFFYNEIQKNVIFKNHNLWSADNPIIIQMAQQGEVEIVRYFLKKFYSLSLISKENKKPIDELICQWAIVREIFEIIPHLDQTQISKETVIGFIIGLLSKEINISPSNQLTPPNIQYQKIIDFFAENKMDLVNLFPDVINILIELNYNDKIIHNLYGNCLKNIVFLKKIQNNSPHLYPSIKEVKQIVLDNALITACRKIDSAKIGLFLNYGANVFKVDEELIKIIFLGNNLPTMKKLIKAGVSIESFQEEALKKQIENNYESHIKYLIELFSNNEKVLACMKESSFNSKLKEKLINELEKVVLKESLDINLEKQMTTNQRKL